MNFNSFPHMIELNTHFTRLPNKHNFFQNKKNGTSTVQPTRKQGEDDSMQ